MVTVSHGKAKNSGVTFKIIQILAPIMPKLIIMKFTENFPNLTKKVYRKFSKTGSVNITKKYYFLL